MASSRQQLPQDFAAALDRVPEARDRFAALPADRQAQWIDWINRARGRRRAARIDDAVRRLLPSSAASEEEVAEPVGPPPERYWWVWLLLLLLLVIAGLLIWFFATRGSDKSTVPDVIGLREDVAAKRIHQKGLTAIPTTAPSRRPVGVVFAQQPDPGVRLKKGSDVTISVSGGPARKSVPDVTDLPLKQATTKLIRAGFQTKVKRVASTRPKGIVTAQQPVAGVTAARGTTVLLSVSNGRKPVIVPSLLGLTQGVAVTRLTKLGLKPRLKNVASDKPAGEVVTQAPAAGQEVDKGSAVKLEISTGRPSTTTVRTTTTTATTATAVTTTASAPVPDVRRLAVVAGVRRLNAAGFRPKVRYVSSTQPAGRIVAQRPSSGSLRRNSPVRLNVSTGPNPAAASSVPNVVGQDQASALSALRQAGFRVVTLFRKTTDASKQGVVIEQQPPAGSSVPRGLYVAIFVGRA
jgi:beta-lactam-binding protein with PASTA domain